jgi:hypothetical protein
MLHPFPPCEGPDGAIDLRIVDSGKIVGHDHGVHQQTRPFRTFTAGPYDHSAWMSAAIHVAGNHCHDRLWQVRAQPVRLDNQCGTPLGCSQV